MKTLITGGNGQLGKELRKVLPTADYSTRKQADLTKENHVQRIYQYYKPDVVIHAAALVGDMSDQINKPTEYLSDNVKMNTLMVDEALNL